jgi:two-component system NarL family sensor kinase
MYMLHRKGCFLFAMAILFTSVATAQQPVVDTFEAKVNAEKTDSMKLVRAARISKYFENIDTVTAWKYFRIAKQIAARQTTVLSRVSVLELEGVLNTKANPAKAYVLYKQAADLCAANDKLASSLRMSQASLLNNLGVVSYLNGDYEGAVNSFKESVVIYEKYYPTETNLISTLANVAATYNSLNTPQRAAGYTYAALQLSEKYGNDKQKASACIAYANSLLNVHKYDSALIMINKALLLTAKTNNQYDLYLCYFNLGVYYEQKDIIDSCIYYFNKALPIAQAINSPYDISQMLNNLANQEMDDKKKEFRSAKIHLDSSYKIISTYDFREIRKEWYQLMAEYGRITGDLKNAFQYLKKYDLLKDSLQNEASLKRIDFLEARYESEKKQQSITRLEAERALSDLSIKQKTTWNYVLGGGLIALAIISFLIFRNYKRKQLLAKQAGELQAQRIRELEKDKQLIAVDSLLKGQEDERSRLAKDLHDGLGGLLSGVKFSLINMKDNLIVTPDNMTVFERSLDMLDTSIKELRRVAHNMMPEMLVKFGLDEALKEYCNGIHATGLLQVKYQSFGMVQRLDSSKEIIIYRIIQELLNNVLKHANAGEVLVQLVHEENRLNILVEDNGKGFDTANLDSASGAGWVGIRSRVDYLKGRMEINSTKDKGTAVTIEFNT